MTFEGRSYFSTEGRNREDKGTGAADGASPLFVDLSPIRAKIASTVALEMLRRLHGKEDLNAINQKRRGFVQEWSDDCHDFRRPA